jgi:hypothetical protein
LAQPEYELSLNVVHHNSPPNSHLVEKTSRHTIYLTGLTSHPQRREMHRRLISNSFFVSTETHPSIC